MIKPAHITAIVAFVVAVGAALTTCQTAVREPAPVAAPTIDTDAPAPVAPVKPDTDQPAEVAS